MLSVPLRLVPFLSPSFCLWFCCNCCFLSWCLLSPLPPPLRYPRPQLGARLSGHTSALVPYFGPVFLVRFLRCSMLWPIMPWPCFSWPWAALLLRWEARGLLSKTGVASSTTSHGAPLSPGLFALLCFLLLGFLELKLDISTAG